MGLEFVCVFGHDAHAGTYREGRHGIELVAEQTISVSPEKTPPFSELGRTEHKLSVERLGETLVITFGSGTVNCSLVTLPVDQVLAQDGVRSGTLNAKVLVNDFAEGDELSCFK